MKTAVTQIFILFFLLSCKEDKKPIQKIVVSEKIDTLFNDENYLVTGKQKSNKIQIKVISEKDYEKYKDWETIIPFRKDIILARNATYKDLEVSRKFKPKQNFSDFKVDVYKGKLSEPNFSTNKDAYNYRTRIREECENGINFAGHYTIISWGCGCPCQSNVVVDRKTGQIFDFFHTSHGTLFQKSSKLIILDYFAIDTATNMIKLTATSNVSMALWNKNKLKIID